MRFRIGEENVLETAKFFTRTLFFPLWSTDILTTPTTQMRREQIKARLSNIQTSYQYDKLMLLDSLYRKKMIIPDSPEERSTSYVSWHTSDILESGQIVFEDFYWNEQNQKIYLKVLVPILEEGEQQDDRRSGDAHRP